MNSENGLIVIEQKRKQEYHVKFASSRFCLLFGINQENVTNLYGDELLGILSPDARHTKALFQKVSYDGAEFHEEYSTKVEGSTDLWLCSNGIVKKDGRNLLYYICYSDITDKIRCMELLQMERHRYKAMCDARAELDKNAIGCCRLNLTKNQYSDGTGDPEFAACFLGTGTVDSFFKNVYAQYVDESMLEKFKSTFNRKALIHNFYKGNKTISMEHLYHFNEKRVVWAETEIVMANNPTTGDLEAVISTVNVHIHKVLHQAMGAIIRKKYVFIICLDALRGSYMMYMKGYGNESPPVIGYDYDGDCEKTVGKYVCADKKSEFLKDIHISSILEHLDTPDAHYRKSVKIVDKNGKYGMQQLDYIYMDYENRQVLITCTDISEMVAREHEQNQILRRALADVKSANKAKSAFLSRISHDMRTPMNGIIGITSMALTRNDLTPEVQQCFIDIKDSGEILMSLINGTLDMNKIESGMLILKPTPVDYKEMIEHIRTCIQPIADKKKIEFVIKYVQRKKGIVLMDKTRVQQIFLNLLSNAVKFTPEGGRVELLAELVALEEKVAHTKIIVRDNGIGISSEFLPKLFDPYEQEYNEITSNQVGSGIGMCIAKRMIEKMGGEIQVNSKKGSGTEAIVYLDFERIKGEYKERTMAELDIQVLDNKRVLLGEDNAMNAKVALCMLEAKGMHVDHAENGQIVVEMFEKSAPGYYDILLMDVRMPVMDGQKATEIIRGMDRPDAKTVPIIAMTANAYIQDVEECRRVGMNAHIAKPIDMKVMYETLIENINN